MTEDYYKNLKKCIEDSGHPVSLKVSTILQQKGWYVANAPRYPYINDELREIDVVGSKESRLFDYSMDMLIIECKKQKDPWIFFKQNHKNDDIFTLNSNRFGEFKEYLDDSTVNQAIFKKHHYYNKELSTYYIVACKNPDKGGPGNTIDKAINQVFRALLFYIKQGMSMDGTIFFYPVIVFDGKLFEAFYRDEELKIQESNHISLYFTIEFKEPLIRYSASGQIQTISESKPYIIDIVRLDYFEEFLANF